MLAIPGPTILLVIGQSLGAGRRAALPLVAGVALGDLTAMTLSLAGLGALLAASATLFTVLKFAGAAYLVWLGVRLWRAPVDAGPPRRSGAARLARRLCRHRAEPEGRSPSSSPSCRCSSTPPHPSCRRRRCWWRSFVTLAAVNAGIYALLAARLSGAVRRPAVRRAFNRSGGALLVGAGIATAAMRRA
jgi:threonine/homoserine/homoserine lactone efflux protein